MRQKSIKPFMKIDRLKSVFLGLLFMAGGFLFWHYLVGNPFNELALIRRGVTTTGLITDVREYEEDNGRGKAVFLHSFTYIFRPGAGQIITARTRDYSGRLPDKIPHSIQVEYLPDNPAVSRIKTTGSSTVTEWLWRTVGIGGLLLAMSLSTGVYIIYREFYPKPEN